MRRKQRIVHGFYLALSVVMLLMVVVGFWPTYFGPLLAGSLHLDSILELHAVVFVGWMIILVLQSGLAFSRRVDLHMKLGWLGFGFGALIIIVGIWLTFDRFFLRLAAGEVREAHRGLVVPLVDMMLFASFFCAAALYRKRPEIHKRLIVVATLVLLGPAVARMTFLTSIPQMLMATLLPLILGIGFDLWIRGRPHPVYMLGFFAFVVSVARLPLRDSEAWFQFSTRLLGSAF